MSRVIKRILVKDHMIQRFNLLVLAIFMVVGSQCCMMLATVPHTPYATLKRSFKEQLYGSQAGLMDYDEYMGFIEPYIQEAEKKLTIVHHLVTERNLMLCDHYFYYLLAYNVACFHNHVVQSAHTQERVDMQGSVLYAIIKKIQDSATIAGLDAGVEFVKTTELFGRANAAYYEHLSCGVRCRLWLYGLVAPRK